ncbi:MAG TPA: tetratricopeptide repeat protein, partial [Chthoniobacterales bacterium]
PAFASPEQFCAPGETPIDTRSDIYSLGVTLWYLLTARTPFTGRTIEELCARQRDELPMEQLREAHVPAPVVALLKSMLAVNPADRPQSARELLALVQRCYVRFEPAARLRRKRAMVAATALAVLLAVPSVAVVLQLRSRSSSALDRAIAVLPFDHLSANTEDQFLTVGIQDEILTKLASLPDLKVISRTSTQKYGTQPADLKTVAQQLGVGRVLQGSVQKRAGRIRVNVQLIDARTATHLWANTYDRALDDAFAVESEVANSIAQQLNASLAGKISSERPTQNSAAYNAYLRGRGLEHAQGSELSTQQAGAAYAEAVQLDPNFAAAWARLALIRSFLYFNGLDRETNSALAVKEAADRALALGPQLGEAWLAQGSYRSRVLRDVAGALEAYREAEKYLPNSALVNEYMVYAECRLGRWRDAEAHFWRAVELDPRNFRLWSTTADQLFIRFRRWAEAEAALDRALEISPGNEEAIAHRADLFQDQGRLEDAARELARLPQDTDNGYIIGLRAWQAMLERNYDESARL